MQQAEQDAAEQAHQRALATADVDPLSHEAAPHGKAAPLVHVDDTLVAAATAIISAVREALAILGMGNMGCAAVLLIFAILVAAATAIISAVREAPAILGMGYMGCTAALLILAFAAAHSRTPHGRSVCTRGATARRTDRVSSILTA
jgi:hypothetical protein